MSVHAVQVRYVLRITFTKSHLLQSLNLLFHVTQAQERIDDVDHFVHRQAWLVRW
jgi:hypothetical protein